MKAKKGFTLIELMIVIAIISIIAAIAIPNLMQSRIRANEAAAISALKNYCNAQVTFQVGRHGRYAANNSYNSSPTGYCTVYPNLFYGNPAADGNGDTDTNLALISKAHADAYIYIVATNADPTPIGDNTSYQGYKFDDPVEITGSNSAHWNGGFAHVGAPTLAGSTGSNMFWVGVEGTVYSLGLAKGVDCYDARDSNPTPLSGSGYDAWQSM